MQGYSSPNDSQEAESYRANTSKNITRMLLERKRIQEVQGSSWKCLVLASLPQDNGRRVANHVAILQYSIFSEVCSLKYRNFLVNYDTIIHPSQVCVVKVYVRKS